MPWKIAAPAKLAQTNRLKFWVGKHTTQLLFCRW